MGTPDMQLAAAPVKNIAETLADVLPTAEVVYQQYGDGDEASTVHVAVPKGYDLKAIDSEHLLPNPRRTKANAKFATGASFLAYVKRHAKDGTTVAWCEYDPQQFKLAFCAVIDDHAADRAGWRSHKAFFEPDVSAEWKAWRSKDRQGLSQVAFAEWVQDHEEDIATASGLPTSLEMHQMATNFVMNEERVLKSSIRLQSGGTRLTYIANPDQGTTEAMQMFERFGLGIPVFHGGSAWSLTARLKYRNNGGKLAFFYELVRPDRQYAGAATELITEIGAGLGDVPLLMGTYA